VATGAPSRRLRDESDARIDSGATNVHLDSEVVIAHFVRET